MESGGWTINTSYLNGVAKRTVLATACAVVFLSACADPSKGGDSGQAAYKALDLVDRTQLKPEFTKIAEVIERSDGSLVVLDVGEHLVAAIDSGLTTVHSLATTGRGPGELFRPTKIFRGYGDSILVLDAGRGTIVAIDPSNTMSDLVSIADVFPGRRIEELDGAGRVYFTALSNGDRDSTEILRLDPVGLEELSGGEARLDTLENVLLPRSGSLGQASRDGRISRSVMTSFDVPFSAQDDWTVSPSGHLVIARAQPFSIVGLASRPIKLRYEAAPITAAEREPYSQLEVEWPDSKGPFVGGSLRLAGTEAWIRLHVQQDSPASYLRMSKGGTIWSITLQDGERLVGVGADGRIYLTRKDPLDVERITVATVR